MAEDTMAVSQRLGKVHVSLEMLTSLLQMPEGYSVREVCGEGSWYNRKAELVIEGPELSEYKPGEHMQTYELKYIAGMPSPTLTPLGEDRAY